MKKIYVLMLFIFLIFTMCRTTPSGADNEESLSFDTIFVTYYCGDINSVIPLSCEKLSAVQATHPVKDYSIPTEVVDTFITNKEVLIKIDSLLDLKRRTDDFNMDARIYVSISKTDGLKRNFCIGHSEKPQILYHNISYQVNAELIRLVKEYSGYYDWL